MSGCGGILGMFNWEEPLGKTQNMLEDYISHLAWEFLGILQEPLEVTGEKDI